MSVRSRFASASLHLFEAAGELVPLPKSLREQQQALQFVRTLQGYQGAAAIGAASELGLFPYLSQSRSLQDISAELGMTEPAARVLLDALASAGILLEDRDGRWAMTGPASKQLLREGWSAVREMINFMLGTWSYWRELPEVLKNNAGHPTLKVYNPDNPLMAEYVRMTTSMLAGPSRELVRSLDLSQVKRMICGTVGISFAAAVTQANPETELVVSCLPRLIAELPAALEQFKMREPVEIIENSGDAEEDKWGTTESYDLVFLARKFAYCGPQHGIDYLKKSMKVLPSGGYVILWEPFADNYELVPWMASNIALVDAMLGEPQPLWKTTDVAAFAEEAGYQVEIHNVARGSTSFIVARRP